MGGTEKQRQLHREADSLFAPRTKKPKTEPERFTGVQGTARLQTLEAWWRGAAKGTEFVYCEALQPIRDETWLRVGELARAGFLRAHERKRAGGGKSWFAVRTAKRIEPELDAQEACLADAATDIIFRALKRAANFARPCPTDAELTRAAGLNSRNQASWRVRRLIDAGLIGSTQVYDCGVPARVVTIAESRHAGSAAGKFTALPRKWAALQRAAENELRRADGDPAQALRGRDEQDRDMRRLREAGL